MKCAGTAISSQSPMEMCMPGSGMPTTRPSVLPGLQKWGTKRSHRVETYSLASGVAVIQRSSEAMMSGSACEAST